MNMKRPYCLTDNHVLKITCLRNNVSGIFSELLLRITTFFLFFFFCIRKFQNFPSKNCSHSFCLDFISAYMPFNECDGNVLSDMELKNKVTSCFLKLNRDVSI